MKNIISILFLILVSKRLGYWTKKRWCVPVTTSPKIDGILNEDIWKNAEAATDFIQISPNPGVNSAKKTEVRIVYDDAAIYIGAMMFDEKPDSILRELTTRDNEANADLFGLIVDTYNDDQNGYGFFVSAAGVQIDARYSSVVIRFLLGCRMV
ncbi:MAG: carbohydrate binding family 9 domain-containing protein [Bacteroidetes bacterium]|nr:carbohydrate binding family 9 domain-containing protein [Bacteroidota bacterium]